MLELDIEKLKEADAKTNHYLTYYKEIGEPTVNQYCAELDEKVAGVKKYLESIRQYNLDFDVPSLQKILIDLSTTIYYTNDAYEKLSLLEDMSKVQYKSKYNEMYTSLQGQAKLEDRKYTAEQLRALSEESAVEEELINFIYTHAAATIKSKIDSANELLRATSKILSSKIQEMNTFGVANKYGG